MDIPGDSSDRPLLGTSLAHMHSKVCRAGTGTKQKFPFPRDSVPRFLRHTCLTGLGGAGADPFAIMKLAGHSSFTISQRRVHPTGETIELAFDRLEKLNQNALEASWGKK